MGQIQIQKVKLAKGDKLEITYRETREDRSHADISEARDTKPHADLTGALSKLALHFAILTDYVSVKNCKAAGALDPFVITGYSIGGKEDEEGIVISGHKITKGGQAIILNTPFTRFEQEEKSAYYFIEGLKDDLAVLETEVLAYLDGSKKAPDPQLSMFPETPEADSEDAEDAMHEDEMPAAPKKGGRKKKAEPKTNHLGQELSDISVPAPKKKGK